MEVPIRASKVGELYSKIYTLRTFLYFIYKMASGPKKIALWCNLFVFQIKEYDISALLEIRQMVWSTNSYTGIECAVFVWHASADIQRDVESYVVWCAK